MNKKSKNDPFFTKTFRLGDDHLALLDQHDRTGEGRSAVLRRLLDQIAQQQPRVIVQRHGLLVCQQEVTGSPG